jgi:hypothetical protein
MTASGTYLPKDECQVLRGLSDIIIEARTASAIDACHVGYLSKAEVEGPLPDLARSASGQERSWLDLIDRSSFASSSSRCWGYFILLG